MIVTGHVSIGADGEFLSLDAGFCDIMLSRSSDMLGRRMVDFTAPADRRALDTALTALRRTRQPFSMVRRLIRGDGSLVRVRDLHAITYDATGAELITVTVERLDGPESYADPATLLATAHALVDGRRERADICHAGVFSEPGWDTMLAVYIAEAEGRIVDAATLASTLGATTAVIARWIRALLYFDVLECETRGNAPELTRAYRLAGATHFRLERYLAQIAAHSLEHLPRG